jgi:prepilin-type N-terminal cleavage/methylation domain-containing protein
MAQPRMSGDRGLTLVEMLITMVITGMIGAATAGAFLIFMTSSRDSGAEQATTRT